MAARGKKRAVGEGGGAGTARGARRDECAQFLDGRIFLATVALAFSVYFVFMYRVDVPMYVAQWRHENVRRRHDYAPFVAAYLKKLAERGDLMQKIDEAKKKQRQR